MDRLFRVNNAGSPQSPSFAASLMTSLVAGAWGSGTPTFTRASTAYVPGYAPNAVVTDPPVALLLDSGEAGFWGARRISANLWSRYDANGILLTPANGASSLVCDQFGNFGYFTGGARADVLGTTAAIRRTMTDVGWAVGATMTVGAATGYDGGANAAASLTGGAVTATNTILFTTVLGAAVRTYSAWVRRKTGTGTIEMTKDGGVSWTDITASVTSAYKQVQVVTASAANPIVGFRITTNTDAIEVDFNTLEAATFANPTPIPVNVSKAADVLTYPSAGNISGTVGTAYVEVTSATAQTGARAIDTALGGSPIIFYDHLYLNDGATRTLGLANIGTASVSKVVTAWGGSASNGAINGTLGNTSPAGFDGNMNLGAAIYVGIDGGAGTLSIFGTIRNARIYPVALSAAQLTALTAHGYL